MTKKISLDIPEDTYEELASLSKHYDLDIKQTILDLLEAIGEGGGSWLKLQSKKYSARAKSQS
jgi:hypothetical protein